MTFAYPLWIIAGLLICVGLLFLMGRLQAKRRAALEKFAAPHLLPGLTKNVSAGRQAAKKIIFLLALFCCFLALARPQYGFTWEESKQRGIDILFVLDTSKSMLTRDSKPNRLERAKLAIMDFVDKLTGDRVGLMPFAGEAYALCPLTGDYQAFADALQEVDTDIVPKGGTNIAAAIRQAETVLNNEANTKILILVTDGENLEGDVLAAADQAARDGVRIFTVGVGTRQGEIIPLAGGGRKGFVKDEEGNLVVSHLDESTLTEIAKRGNGIYAPLGQQGEGLQTIYDKMLASIPKQELAGERRKVPLERFQWPLGAAAALLAMEFMIGTRKSGPFGLRLKDLFRSRKGGGMMGILLLAASLLSCPSSSHSSEGETAYDAGNYPKAAEFYGQLLKKHPDDPKILFNSGAAAYKNRQYDEAIAAFNGALKGLDPDLQEKAYYNRGNAQFKKGEASEDSDSRQTLEQWRQAIDSYTASLALNPGNRDAADNLKLAQKAYDELKKKEEQQQKQQNKQGQEQNHPDRQDENNNGSQQQGQKDKQEQDAGKVQQNPAAPPNDDRTPGPQKQETAETQGKNQPQPQGQSQAQAQPQAATGTGNSEEKAREDSWDAERRKEGKMTREDAQRLLDSMRYDEGKMLNFAPSDGKDEKPRRDW
jgi:Ca-activated chloride channel family protein